MSKKGAFIYQQIELTTAEWAANTTVYPASVWLFERLESGKFNMKLSDGEHTYAELPAVMQDIRVTVKQNDATAYVLEIETAAGTITTPNLRGKDGEPGPTYAIATASVAGLVKPVSVIAKPSLQGVTTTAGRYYQVQMSPDGNMFVNVPWSDNNTTYAQATSSTLGLVKIGYPASGKNYPVQLDSSGRMYVSVPWTDTNTTYAIATASAAGLVKPVSVIAKPSLQGVTTTAGRYYQVQMSTDGNMFVNVPWSDNNTTYAQATDSVLGLVKIGYPASEKNYPVQLDSSGRMYVSVPWTDTNTTYGVVGANGSTGLIKNGSAVTSAAGYTACPIVDGVPYYTDSYTAEEKQKVADSLRLKEYADVASLGALPATPYNLRFAYAANSPQAIAFADAAAVPEMQEFYLSIKNNTSATITQPLPNGSGWQSAETSLDIEAGMTGGVSIKKEHGTLVVRV